MLRSGNNWHILLDQMPRAALRLRADPDDALLEYYITELQRIIAAYPEVDARF